jgi:hypothetical protein
MRPLLRAALAATLLATLAMALWPQDEAAVVPVVAAARRPAAAPAAPRLAAGAEAGGRSAAAVAAVSAGVADAASATPSLPTRAADWPAPPAAALAAWQGQAAAPPPTAAATASRRAASQAAAAAPGPAAPVFPYRWIGQLDDGGAPQLLLASAQRSVGVRLGATLDARWRLVRHASGQLLAQALPDGESVPVPGAPLLPPDLASPSLPR